MYKGCVRCCVQLVCPVNAEVLDKGDVRQREHILDDIQIDRLVAVNKKLAAREKARDSRVVDYGHRRGNEQQSSAGCSEDALKCQQPEALGAELEMPGDDSDDEIHHDEDDLSEEEVIACESCKSNA